MRKPKMTREQQRRYAGLRRAEVLTAAERRAISSKGGQATVEKHGRSHMFLIGIKGNQVRKRRQSARQREFAEVAELVRLRREGLPGLSGAAIAPLSGTGRRGATSLSGPPRESRAEAGLSESAGLRRGAGRFNALSERRGEGQRVASPI